MLVNSTNLSVYHATLLTKDVQTAEVVVFDDWLSKSLSPLYIGQKMTYNAVKCQLLIEAETDQLCLEYVSNLVKDLVRCTIKFDDITFYYTCTLSTKTTTRVTLGVYALDVEFKVAHSYLPETTVTFGTTTYTIAMPGNVETEAIVTLTPTVGLGSVIITGFGKPMTINNLHAGVPVVINGEMGLVTEGSLNKFSDTDMWSFPSLQPGSNPITINQNGISCQVKFKSKFM